MKDIYEPGIWKSYSIQDKTDFLFELGARHPTEYALRDFADLPLKIREAVENLENFEA